MGRAAKAGGETRGLASAAAFALEAALTAALAYILAQLFWVAYPPYVGPSASLSGAAGAPAPSMAAVSMEGVNPFRRSAVSAVDPLADAPETTLNLVLVGVRAASGPDVAGSAIIQTPDNVQRLYTVGDQIAPGVTLAAAEASRVVILRDGVRESVSFAERARVIDAGRSGPAPTPAAGGDAASAPSGDGRAVEARALLDAITPTFRPGGGVVVVPRGDGAAFAAAGLEPSDVVRKVNGVAVDNAEAWSGALAGVGPGSRLVVEIERAGRPVAIEIELR